MTCDLHVGEGQQAREHIVLEYAVGDVLEEDIGLLLVHIQTQVTDAA